MVMKVNKSYVIFNDFCSEKDIKSRFIVEETSSLFSF